MRIWRILPAKHDDQLVTLPEAAQILGIGPGAAARLVRAGQLFKVRVAGAPSRFRMAEVLELAARMARPPR